ncbi:D-alanyl-D-alanine carboxypeptidase [Candidatus Uhrbacteria bacterium]|jgi:D-alanyl-D-alanine carboxypeptidase|nr:D-alanyl-D-alanine carboxypeptidase [Candidatus Uhrbacteria bacterium]
MIIKLFSQIMITGMLLQFFPADVGQMEMLATLPEAGERSFDMFAAYNEVAHLPLSSGSKVAPVKMDKNNLGVITSAQSAIVVDRASGEVLFEKNISSPRSIGSITKLMTAYVFLKTNPDLGASAAITGADYRAGGRLNISLNDQVTVGDLLTASLVSSDNSATAALVRLSGLSLGDFVARMNETAALMGMQSTTFADETGLSSKNRSVVMDIAIMLDQMRDNKIIREVTQVSSTSILGSSGREYHIGSTDELLETFVNSDPYKILIAKTGFLPEAGYCLGTVFSYDDGQELLVVVLGAETKKGRFQDVKSLAVWAYDTFNWTKIR